MKILIMSAVLITLIAMPSAAQSFDDVPPWHWARAAIDHLVAGGIIVGFPPNDRDLVLNAVTQVYESFAHASHPEAQAWAERFLTKLPANWPQPLQRSPLLRVRLEQFGTRLAQGKGSVLFVAVTATRSGTARARVQASVEQDPDGRWRVNYTSLAAAQPGLFR